MWTLIRLFLEEQSDLGPHCLQKLLLKSQADDKVFVSGSLRVKRSVIFAPKHILWIFTRTASQSELII